MQNPSKHTRRGRTAKGSMTSQRTIKSRSCGRRKRDARQRRHSLSRLRSAYFSRAGELAARYNITFDRVILHLWRLRGGQPRILLRNVAHVEDLVMAVACIDGSSRAWADVAELHERTLARRCRDCKDELEATVQVRKFIATARRDALAHHSMLDRYAGVKPLRSWLSEAFDTSKQSSRRSAFVLDPSDSCFGAPLRFMRTGAD